MITEIARVRLLRCSATLTHAMATTIRQEASRKSTRRVLYLLLLQTLSGLLLGWNVAFELAKNPSRLCSLPLNMQPTWRRCRRKSCCLHQFRGQHAHRRLPPHKSVSSDSCRWSVRLLPRLPRKQFPTRRRCVHVFVHPAERQPKVTFLIQNDQRHHAISPETPAAWQPSTCKRQRQGPALLRAQ